MPKPPPTIVTITVNQRAFGNLLEPIKKCQSNNDGDCWHVQCPQLKDNEPTRSRRSCPIYDWDRER